MRPLILIDVDFVLNPDFRGRWDGPEHDSLVQAGWMMLEGLLFNSRPVWLNRHHGIDLMHAALACNAELVWATLWHHVANDVISPVLMLPQLPVIPFPHDTHKAVSALAWTAGRPFAWFDDQPDIGEVTRLIAGGQPHLIVQVDPAAGLTAADIGRARDWLGAFSG